MITAITNSTATIAIITTSSETENTVHDAAFKMRDQSTPINIWIQREVILVVNESNVNVCVA